MASLEPFVLRIKPALDAFLKHATKQNLKVLENELSYFNWTHMSIFNIQVLVPLVLKLDELSHDNQDLRAGCLDCITLVTSKVYLKELTALRTMLVIALKQVRESDKALTKINLSEEIKLATVKCIMECLKRSTSDVLEQFYTKGSGVILGQILLTLVEFIEKEKYKKLVLTCLECLLVVFYVNDEADRMDVVLRSQVANTIFIYLPKIVTVLYQLSTADDTVGETLKIMAIKALGRILCLIYEETSDNSINAKYDSGAYKKLLFENLTTSLHDNKNENDILAIKKNRDELEKHMKKLQCEGRTPDWIHATSKKLRIVFTQTRNLSSHKSTKIRAKYSEMCCLLLETCSHNLRENFVFMLESVVALSEDEDTSIRNNCCKCLCRLQNNLSNEGIFDENAELLLDEHLTKLPRVIARCDDEEQYTELTFLKGFLKILSPKKLQLLLSVPHNLEMFCMCIISAMDFQVSSGLLEEEYSFREVDVGGDKLESNTLPWRTFKNLSSKRSVKCLQEICCTLGSTPIINRIIVDYLLDMLQQQNVAMNEILMMLLWLTTAKETNNKNQCQDLKLVKLLLDELLHDNHWNLALEPDQVDRLKVNKPTDWYVDRTPGLYESAVEIRKQDCDSDDETEDASQKQLQVTINDVEFNVLHTCIVLDCLGHCALYIAERFDSYVFQTLHKVLLKLAHSNKMVYNAANFALVSIQKSLRFNTATQLIEGHIDYITYHLNRLLRKAPESKSAVDILTVVLQFSSRNNLAHLEVIFQTIFDECSKQNEAQNVLSYLKVFNAFLRHVNSWLVFCFTEIEDVQKMNIDDVGENEDSLNSYDLLNSWLNVLGDNKNLSSFKEDITKYSSVKQNCEPHEAEKDIVDNEDDEVELPRHIAIIKSILQQVIKFLNNSEVKLQILSLECLICGVPLLHDYENELLPLIHSTWSPLVEKFRQKNALVLNRCFSLLEVLAINAKDFITKRCLDDVLPFLKNFLQQAAMQSAKETILVSTQEYKLQVKLLQEFPNFVECLDLDGKHLNDISEIVVQYLSEEQPKDLQNLAIGYFEKLRNYNGPLLYLVIIKKSHLKHFENNVGNIMKLFKNIK